MRRVELSEPAGVRWFGGPGQNAGPWEIPVETFQRPVADLARDCGGSSFLT